MKKPPLTIGTTPDDAQTWVKRGRRATPGRKPDTSHIARITIEVTPALRSAIKLHAFARGLTVAALLRHVLEREFATTESSACPR